MTHPFYAPVEIHRFLEEYCNFQDPPEKKKPNGIKNLVGKSSQVIGAGNPHPPPIAGFELLVFPLEPVYFRLELVYIAAACHNASLTPLCADGESSSLRIHEDEH